MTALPAEGRGGNPPAFPLPKIVRYEVNDDGEHVVGQKQSTKFRTRELAIWRDIWKTPQACAWDIDPWRWPTIAEYCRLKTVIEADPDASAALVGRLREYRNEIGLSPDGLRANGWAIARDEVAAKRDEHDQEDEPPAPPPARRLRST